MIEEFRSAKLVDAAKSLGVNPFELVRLSVALGEPTSDLRFSSDSLATIQDKAGIRRFWADRALPSTGNPIEASVRGACGLLLDLGFVGNTGTRLDNLSRGLTDVQAEVIDEATALLAEEGAVLLMSSSAGLQVSVAPGFEGQIRAIADGSNTPATIASLWAE